MAGGPTTPAMAIAASRAGSLGILAAGYKTASAIDEQIKQVRAEAIPFGVNVFAPNPLPIDPAEYHRYAGQIQTDAQRFGVTLAPDPIEDTDTFDEKITLLLDDPVPLVSFTFGIPPRQTIAALQHAGTVIVQTVTTVDEAITARDAGVDMLAVQAHTAGGHSGTLTPATPSPPTPIADLVAQITHCIEVPVIAAGGLATPEAVVEVMSAGAVATMVGTVLLRATESGASATHRAALTDPSPGGNGNHPGVHRPARPRPTQCVHRRPRGRRPLGLPGDPLPHQSAAQSRRSCRTIRLRPPMGRHRVPARHRRAHSRHSAQTRRRPLNVCPLAENERWMALWSLPFGVERTEERVVVCVATDPQRRWKAPQRLLTTADDARFRLPQPPILRSWR